MWWRYGWVVCEKSERFCYDDDYCSQQGAAKFRRLRARVTHGCSFPQVVLLLKISGFPKQGKQVLRTGSHVVWWKKSNKKGHELLFKCWSQRKHSAKCLLDVMTGSHFKARNDFDIKRMEQHNIVCGISEWFVIMAGLPHVQIRLHVVITSSK